MIHLTEPVSRESMSRTLKTLLERGRDRLATMSQSARLDAELLLGHVLEAGRAELYAHPERLIDAEQEREYARLIDERSRGKPVAQLTGRREFWSHSTPHHIFGEVLLVTGRFPALRDLAPVLSGFETNFIGCGKNG